MLKDKYSFKKPHYEWCIFNAHIKAMIENNHPKKGSLLELSVLRLLAERLDAKLCVFKKDVRFTLKQPEAIAVYLAYTGGFLPRHYSVMEIVTIIDKQL